MTVQFCDVSAILPATLDMLAASCNRKRVARLAKTHHTRQDRVVSVHARLTPLTSPTQGGVPAPLASGASFSRITATTNARMLMSASMQ